MITAPKDGMCGQCHTEMTADHAIVTNWYRGIKTRMVIPRRLVVGTPDEWTVDITPETDLTGMATSIHSPRRLTHDRTAARQAHRRQLKRNDHHRRAHHV